MKSNSKVHISKETIAALANTLAKPINSVGDAFKQIGMLTPYWSSMTFAQRCLLKHYYYKFSKRVKYVLS